MSLRPALPLLGLIALASQGCTTNADCQAEPWLLECGGTGDVPDPGALAPRSVVVPCGWNFGSVEVDTVSAAGLSVVNSGTEVLHIESISAEAPFSVGAAEGIQVEPGSAYLLTVRFEPAGYGAFDGTLVVRTDDPERASWECVVAGRVDADLDGDGFESAEAGGPDCDDTDPAVHPEAEEAWYDGVDSDCDGHSDFDQDRDGYESDVFNADPESQGGDCVDVDPGIHPEAADLWYDGVDSDCDGAPDYDQDGDTWSSAAYGGEDCDDLDREVNPDATETFNGADDDCDGDTDEDARADDADAILYGDWSSFVGYRAGHDLAVGDFDGDGLADVAVGAPYYDYTGGSSSEGIAQGTVALFMGEGWADEDEIDTDSDWLVGGEDDNAELGTRVANLGDWDGDGLDDLAVSAPAWDSWAGRVYVFSGADVDGSDAEDALLTLTGEDDYQLGLAVAEHTDMDGDGAGDLVAWGVDNYDTNVYLAVHYGGDTGEVAWSDADATFKVSCGEAYSSYYSWCGGIDYYEKGGTEEWAVNAHAGADLDGDGYHDLILGDKFNDDEEDEAGKAWILWGGPLRLDAFNSRLGAMTTTIAQGEEADDMVGTLVHASPDADGDGDAEVWVLDGARDLMYVTGGGSHLRDGPFELAVDFDAELDWRGMGETSGFSNVGDWTGDGVDDIGVGSTSGRSNGQLMLLESRAWSGVYDADEEVLASISGATDLDGDGDEDGATFTGGLPLTHRDLDSDGRTDLVVGDYGLYDEKGGVFFFYATR